MSYLLFLDESGHDHRNCPYEVHGGFAIHAAKLWAFVNAIGALEIECFGDRLERFGSELKGSRLLERKRFVWAAQQAAMEGEQRRERAMQFLRSGLNGQVPSRSDFAAFGQASLLMARGIFNLLASHDARVFAAAIPRGTPIALGEDPGLPRKDIVFLLERYFYLLEEKNESGLIVLDESDKELDRHLIRRLEKYFRETATGRHRAGRIVPAPMFVASDMNTPIQVADVVIYAINWGFRLVDRGMTAPVRPEIGEEFGGTLYNLQYRGSRSDGRKSFETYGICFVSDPYEGRGA